VDAIINDAGDLPVKRVTKALVERYRPKEFVLCYTFNQGVSSGQYWVRFAGAISRSLPDTIPVSSAEHTETTTASFTLQRIDPQICDICKRPRSERSCECQVRLILHRDLCSRIDGWALRIEAYKESMIAKQEGRREINALWAQIRAHPDYDSQEDELMYPEKKARVDRSTLQS
jgi:hypothetical protein